MLVPATEVVMVEFEKKFEELEKIDVALHQRAVDAMIAIQKPKPVEVKVDVDKLDAAPQDEASPNPKPTRKRATRRKPPNDGANQAAG